MKRTDSAERRIGAVLSYVSIIVNMVIGLLYTPFLVRMLGQSEYGLYSLIASIIGYLTVLDFGFGNAVVVYTSKYRAQRAYDREKMLHGMFFLIFCIIAVVTAVLGVVLYFLTPVFFASSMTEAELGKAKILVIILIVNLIFNFVFTIFQSIVTAHEKFIYQKLLNIASTILKPAFMIPFLFLGLKSITMALIITGVNIAIMLINFGFCKKKLGVSVKFSGFDKPLFREIFKYSFYIFLGVVVDKVNYSSDSIILGAVSGTIAVSVYAVAISIDEIFRNISIAISGVFLPKVTKMVTRKVSDRELSDEFIKIGRLQFYIVFLIASGFVLVGKEFIRAWVGDDFMDAYYIVVILMIPSCVPLIQNLGISILQAKNMHKFRSILYAIIAVVNIAISIPLAQHWGGIGAAVGTAIAVVTGNAIIINIYYYKKVHLDIPRFWVNILRLMAPTIAPIGVTILVQKMFSGLSGYWYVITFGMIYAVSYCATMYLFSMNLYEKSLIHGMIKKVTRKVR